MLPSLPKVDIPKFEVPTKFITGKSDDGYYYATSNWDEDIPIWRRYKRYGWALRYVNGKRPTKRAADLCQACGAIMVSNMDRCLRCGTRRWLRKPLDASPAGVINSMNAEDVKYHFKKYFGYDMPQTQINVFSPEFIDFCLYIASQQSAHPTRGGHR